EIGTEENEILNSYDNKSDSITHLDTNDDLGENENLDENNIDILGIEDIVNLNDPIFDTSENIVINESTSKRRIETMNYVAEDINHFQKATSQRNSRALINKEEELKMFYNYLILVDGDVASVNDTATITTMQTPFLQTISPEILNQDQNSQMVIIDGDDDKNKSNVINSSSNQIPAPINTTITATTTETPMITTTASSSKTSEIPTTENATSTIMISESTTELFKSIKEYLNGDLSIKSAEHVYEFLRKVKDVPRIDRGHVINILTRTHDPIILQKLVNDRCSYILRNWIKEEAKLPDSNLLLRLLKTVQHLPVDLEVSTSCGLGRVVNNKKVKESNIPGVADIASKLLNRWLQDARQLSESAKLNQPIVKGIFEDMFDFSNVGNPLSSASSNIFKPQSPNMFKIKDPTKTFLKSEKFATKVMSSSLSPISDNNNKEDDVKVFSEIKSSSSISSKKRKRVSFAPDYMLEQVKLFENKYPDDVEDDMSLLPVGFSHHIGDIRDFDRSEGRAVFKRMRKAPSTIWYTPLLLKPREKQTLEVIYLTIDQVPDNPHEPDDDGSNNNSQSLIPPKNIPLNKKEKKIEKLKQKIELKEALNDAYSTWLLVHPNNIQNVVHHHHVSWGYDPNQNASNNVGLGIGIVAGPTPGINVVNNNVGGNSNNQAMPNYYYHHPNPNIPAPIPVPQPPLQLPQPPLPQTQQQLPLQLPPYQPSNASQPNQPPQPLLQFPYFVGNNHNPTVQPNFYPSPQFQLPNNAPSPTQFPLPNNAPLSNQFQLPNNAPSPTQFQLSNNTLQPNQYQVPTNAPPSTQFMGIIRGGGRIGPSSSGTGRPASGKGSECWYYKAGRCTLGNECNFLHSDH
ncbi:5267_t:CDS:2, partial [Entrophospora sp. SA101]